jgi:hypothetical protein
MIFLRFLSRVLLSDHDFTNHLDLSFPSRSGPATTLLLGFTTWDYTFT